MGFYYLKLQPLTLIIKHALLDVKVFFRKSERGYQ